MISSLKEFLVQVCRVTLAVQSLVFLNGCRSATGQLGQYCIISHSNMKSSKLGILQCDNVKNV